MLPTLASVFLFFSSRRFERVISKRIERQKPKLATFLQISFTEKFIHSFSQNILEIPTYFEKIADTYIAKFVQIYVLE
jgi:hypothetical protein